MWGMRRGDVYFALKRLEQTALVVFGLSWLWPGPGLWTIIAFCVLVVVAVSDQIIVRKLLYPDRPKPDPGREAGG
ncbi:hypothetical protein I41_36730 [Lacipirellula limnantheis]|uniref:Uncharacterized protein n=1 Tax=Lacipirellula limnantheis TaxID=2528024 RepID=A0A517U1H6_9BACT|nr:hypothetical protein I41_36730 [Lacipirellula limnantheis]